MDSRWFHMGVMGPEATRLLQLFGKDGSFLVRTSAKNPDAYSLSLRWKDKVNHVRIENDADHFRINDSEAFATLHDLIEFYFSPQNELTLVGETGPMKVKLVHPFNSNTITETWFHGVMPGVDAENVLREQDVGCFLVRESTTSPGVYVISVVVQEGTIIHVRVQMQDNSYHVDSKIYQPTLPELIQQLRINAFYINEDDLIILTEGFHSTSFTAASIDTYMQRLGTIGLKRELDQLNSLAAQDIRDNPQQYASSVAQSLMQKRRNRYGNILPYDYNRVVLMAGGVSDVCRSSDVDDNGLCSPVAVDSDYINASRLHSQGGTVYLACQGPKEATAVDMWRMIWQEQSKVVLMLTRLVENGTDKCYPYWPHNEEEVKEFVSEDYHWEVQCIKRQSFRGYDVSRLVLRRFAHSAVVGRNVDSLLQEAAGDEGAAEAAGSVTTRAAASQMSLRHFYFHGWPDHGVPKSPNDVLSLLDSVKSVAKHTKCPITVHCSAGIGRTGTIILIDQLIEKVDTSSLGTELDISKALQILRRQRKGMVQTSGQYEFIFQTVRTYIRRKVEEKKSLVESRQAKSD